MTNFLQIVHQMEQPKINNRQLANFTKINCTSKFKRNTITKFTEICYKTKCLIRQIKELSIKYSASHCLYISIFINEMINIEIGF